MCNKGCWMGRGLLMWCVARVLRIYTSRALDRSIMNEQVQWRNDKAGFKKRVRAVVRKSQEDL